MNKHFFSLCLMLLTSGVGSVWALTPVKPSGNGTYSSPFRIYTAEELVYFADYVNQGNIRTYANLMSDIDLTGVTWEPIMHFSGEFLGNRHVLKNLHINGSYDACGLFGSIISNARVANFTLESPVVINRKDEIADIPGSNTGSVCGIAENSFITNITVVNPDVRGELCVGGVVGYVYDNVGVSGGHISGYTDLENCQTTGGTVRGTRDVGGICGSIYSTDCLKLNNGADVYGSENVGGVFGKTYICPVRQCQNLGKVKGSDSTTGGLVGSSNGAASFYLCANYGELADRGGAFMGCVNPDSGDGPFVVSFEQVLSVGTRSFLGNGDKANVQQKSDCYAAALGDEALTSGQIAYQLQQAGNNVTLWGQEVGTDPYPSLFDEYRVYKHDLYACNDEDQTPVQTLYVNTGYRDELYKQHYHVELVPVREVTCTHFGVAKPYYECQDCHWQFQDEQYNDFDHISDYWWPNWGEEWIEAKGHRFDPDGKCSKCGLEPALIADNQINLGDVEYEYLATSPSYEFTYFRYHAEVGGTLTLSCTDEDYVPICAMFIDGSEAVYYDWYEMCGTEIQLVPGDYYFGFSNNDAPGALDDIFILFEFTEQPALHHFAEDGTCTDPGCDATLTIVEGTSLKQSVTLGADFTQFYRLTMPVDASLLATLSLSDQQRDLLDEESELIVTMKVYDEGWFEVFDYEQWLESEQPYATYDMWDSRKGQSYYVTFSYRPADESEESEAPALPLTLDFDLSLGIQCHYSMHQPIWHEGKPATCTETGLMGYYECQVCGGFFKDEECSNCFYDEDGFIITDIANLDLTLPNGHHYDFETQCCRHCGLTGIATYYVDLTEQTEELDAADGYDLMKFVAPLNGTLQVWTEGDTDTYGCLLDEELNIIQYNDEDGEMHNFRLEQEVEQGKTYWIGVRDYYGSECKNVMLRLRMDEYSAFDLNGDEHVDVADVLKCLFTGEVPDLDGDGMSDEADLKALQDLILRMP